MEGNDSGVCGCNSLRSFGILRVRKIGVINRAPIVVTCNTVSGLCII
jgi:hypothetical protein